MAEETKNIASSSAPEGGGASNRGPGNAAQGGGGPNRGPQGGGYRGGGRPPGGRQGGRPQRQEDSDGLHEKVLFINRSSKVVKGGRRFAFSALIVVGDKEGGVGLGVGKAGEVAEAIRKASQNARDEIVKVSLDSGTLPHDVLSVYDGAKVLLKPASPGTGVIAGKTVRAVAEAAGIKNLLSKSLGSNNPTNVAKATLEGLRQLRLRSDIYRARGLSERSPKPTEAAPAAEPAEATAETEA